MEFIAGDIYVLTKKALAQVEMSGPEGYQNPSGLLGCTQVLDSSARAWYG